MLTITQRHDQVTAHFRGLPDAKQVASFNFIDQAVILRTLQLEDIKKASVTNNFQERWSLHFEIWLNSHHEYCHWADMTTSIFGLQWLNQIVNVVPASDADLENPSYAFKETCKSVNKRMANIHLPEYYSTVENDLPRPWRSAGTVGRAFAIDGSVNQDHPLWFVRFDSVEGVPIARQPISIASLLELRAVNTEMQFGFGLNSQLPDKGVRAVAQSVLSQSLLDRLYVPELTVYSAAAHWFANHRKISDFASVSISASEVAWFCLDAPTVWLSQLASTSAFTQRHGELLGQLMTRSLQRGDRGALYFLLASDERIRVGSAYCDIDAVLRQEWHVTLADLEARSQMEKGELLARLQGFPVTAQLSEIWRQNLQYVRSGKGLDLAAKNVRLPAVILADDTPLNVQRMKWGEEAFDKNIFDPRPFFEEFMKADIALSKFGMYTDQGLQCFSDL